jgi:hypothetical protein
MSLSQAKNIKIFKKLLIIGGYRNVEEIPMIGSFLLPTILMRLKNWQRWPDSEEHKKASYF